MSARSIIRALFVFLVLTSVSGWHRVRAATVTNTNDSGTGSLRQAVIDAIPGSTIDFSVTGTITLTSGEIAIAKNLTITGPGAASLAISGNDANRIFNLTIGNLSISGLTLKTARKTGGNGGAIVTSAGTGLTLQDCVLSGNRADNGAAVYSTSDSLTVTNCTFDSNVSAGSGSGLYVNQGPVTVTGCTFKDNSADYGAALQIIPGRTVTISGSTFLRNAAGNTGGAINNHGTATIDTSTFDSNTASSNSGGALQNNDNGTATFTRCTFTRNGAHWGPVLQNGTVGTAHLYECTLSGNTATNQGGAINNHGALDIHASTIVLNTATNTGGGIQNNANGVVTLHSTILANNTASSSGPDFSGNLNSQDYNLIRSTSGAAISGAVAHNITGLDPVLGSLLDNGGPTATHALLGTSPALDKGDNAITGPPLSLNTDQRLFGRQVGSAVDIGAFERGAGSDLRISGHIEDQNGDPVQGVLVSASSSTATTDTNGDYVIGGLASGSYDVTPALTHYTFSPGVRNVTVTNADVVGIDFVGTTVYRTITGIVANSSGNGIPNVQITRTGGANVVTDANGRYIFTSVPQGNYTIAPLITPALTGVTFFPSSRNVSVSTVNLTNMNFTASFSLTGRVSNHDGLGLPNIQVTRSTPTSAVTVVTDGSGNYRFTNVLSGNYTVAPNITPAMSGMTFFPVSYSITVNTNNLTNINFNAFFTVKGRVATSAGVPMVNVLVRRSTPTSSTSVLTDSNGNYTFSGVRSGTYTITPTQSGKTFNPVSRSVTVSSLNLTNINFVGSG